MSPEPQTVLRLLIAALGGAAVGVERERIVAVFTQGIARLLPRSELLVQEVAVLAVEWLILFWMYKRRIFIKA